MTQHNRPEDLETTAEADAPAEMIIVNGVEYPAPEEEFRSLLQFILVDLGRTDQKFSCRGGQCGTCMLRMDGKWTKSCITPARWAIGKEVLTQGELIRLKQEERARQEAEAARAAAAGEVPESAPTPAPAASPAQPTES